MIIIFLRAVIIIITLLVVMRLMGKRQIGEMQPYEFVLTLIIAEVACVPMSDVSIPLIYGIVSVLAVFILHQLLTIFEQLSQPLKFVISGKPAIVINKDGVDLKELKKNNLGIDDLIESLRATGNFSLDGVIFAIYESNGKLSVLKNEEIPPCNDLPILLVNDGKVDDKNIERCHLDDTFLQNIMNDENIKSPKEIEVLTIDGTGKIYFKKKNNKYKTFNLELDKRCSSW